MRRVCTEDVSHVTGVKTSWFAAGSGHEAELLDKVTDSKTSERTEIVSVSQEIGSGRTRTQLFKQFANFDRLSCFLRLFGASSEYFVDVFPSYLLRCPIKEDFASTQNSTQSKKYTVALNNLPSSMKLG